MELTDPDHTAPAICAQFALLIGSEDTDLAAILATARDGRAVTRDIDNGTEIFWVIFLADGDNILRGLTEDQLSDEISRREKGICTIHW